MNRLDYLLGLRRRIDVEIDRERAAVERVRTLTADTSAAKHSRGGWTQRVVDAAAAQFDVTPDALTGRGRRTDVVRARHVAAWCLRESGRTFTEIGAALGRDHSTIIHGVRAVEGDRALRDAGAAVLTRLTGDVAA